MCLCWAFQGEFGITAPLSLCVVYCNYVVVCCIYLVLISSPVATLEKLIPDFGLFIIFIAKIYFGLPYYHIVPYFLKLITNVSLGYNINYTTACAPSEH